MIFYIGNKIDLPVIMTALITLSPFLTNTGCNAATCDSKWGYCRLGQFKGLHNASWISDNNNNNDKTIFRVKEYINCEGLYVL